MCRFAHFKVISIDDDEGDANEIRISASPRIHSDENNDHAASSTTKFAAVAVDADDESSELVVEPVVDRRDAHGDRIAPLPPPPSLYLTEVSLRVRGRPIQSSDIFSCVVVVVVVDLSLSLCLRSSRFRCLRASSSFLDCTTSPSTSRYQFLYVIFKCFAHLNTCPTCITCLQANDRFEIVDILDDVTEIRIAFC